MEKLFYECQSNMVIPSPGSDSVLLWYLNWMEITSKQWSSNMRTWKWWPFLKVFSCSFSHPLCTAFVYLVFSFLRLILNQQVCKLVSQLSEKPTHFRHLYMLLFCALYYLAPLSWLLLLKALAYLCFKCPILILLLFLYQTVLSVVHLQQKSSSMYFKFNCSNSS